MSYVIHLKNNYPLHVVSYADVISDINFENETDAIITKDIIKHLETKAGDTIKADKTVLLPYFGSIRKSVVKKELRKTHIVLKYAKKTMSAEDYKQYAKENYKQCVNKVAKIDDAKRSLTRLIAANRKRYNVLYKGVGEIYANTWIYSLSLIKVIEFDSDVEDLFNTLNNETSNRKPNIYR